MKAQGQVGTDEAAVALFVLELQQLVDHLAGRSAEDEVADVVIEDARLAAHLAGVEAQVHLAAVGALVLQIGVADLEGQVPHMGAEVVQLLQRGGTIRAGEVGHQRRAILCERHADSYRSREPGEGAVANLRGLLGMVFALFLFVAGCALAGFGLVLVGLDAATELQAPALELELLVGEGR